MTRSVIIGSVAALLLLAGVSTWYVRGYLRERAAIVKEIDKYEDSIRSLERLSSDHGAIRAELRSIASTALKNDLEGLDAALRTALGQILADSGLTDRSVTARRAEEVVNPAFRTRSQEFKKASDEAKVGFVQARATASARGTLEQVMRAVATLRSQEWVHRLDSVSVRPADRERLTFKLDAVVTTVYLPGFDPPERTSAWVPARADVLDRALAMARENLFRAPDPPPPEPVAVKPPKPPRAKPKPRPEEIWRVSAVVTGEDGPELWLRNSASKASRVLLKGGSAFGIEFVDGSGEGATIRVGEDLFEVSLGQTLAQRRPVLR